MQQNYMNRSIALPGNRSLRLVLALLVTSFYAATVARASIHTLVAHYNYNDGNLGEDSSPNGNNINSGSS